MKLRLHLHSRRPPPRWSIALLPGLAVALLTLVPGAMPAAAGINDYTTTLYLSGQPTSIPALAGSYTLVTTAGPGTPAMTPSAASSGSAGVLSGTYQYEYTVVDATGGETAASPASPGVTVSSKTINVNGLPAGVTIRLYRTCSCSSALFYRVAQFTPTAATPQFVDNNLDGTTNVPANLLPLTQNRPMSGAGGIGYYEFAPGVPLVTTASVSTKVAGPNVSNKGWVVDAAGRVSIPGGTWTFTNKFKGTAGPVGTTAHLVVGVYVVDDTGAVVSTVIDPTGAGENMVNNIATTAGTTTLGVPNTITTTINGVSALTLASNQHLYVQYWRRQTANTSNTTTNMYVYDGTASVTHPAANAYPDVPALGSVAAYVNATPTLSATYTDPDADTGSLQFQLRSDNNCSNPASALATTTVSGLANGASPTWTPPVNLANKGTYPDGTYYWCVQATDTYAGGTGPNVSGWSMGSFVVDTVPPTVSSVTASNGSGAYNAGKTIHVQINFSEPVNVSGTPKLALNTVPAESATYVSGSGTSTLTFDYTVQATDNVGTLDYATAAALTLNGGSIADRATNAATPTLPAPGAAGSLAANTSIKIDTVPPTVSGVTASSGAYNAGTTVHVQVTFGEKVNVTGTPQLALNTVPAESATYASGSGTTSLTFDYTVGATDNVDPLDYANTGALTLNGGTIADLAGNAGTLTLAAPGAAGSLGASASVRIDTNLPNTPVPNSPAAGVYLGAPPTIKAKYSDGDTGGTGTVHFRICTDNLNCATTVAQIGQSSSGLANGATGTWTPGALATGVYYWQASGTDAAGNVSAAWTTPSSFTVDLTSPVTPTVGAIAPRIKVMPLISGTYSDPPYADAGTLTFELCADSACTSVLQITTQSGIASGGNGSWTPSSAADGLYYWKVTATDSVGNASSATGSFTLDTVAPAKPALGSPTNALRVNSPPTLNATFTNADPTDNGTVTFQLCSDAACSSVLAGHTSATVGSGAGVSWATGPLADGTYYWRASSLDAAGNQGAWSSVRSFVLDTNPPAVSQSSPADGSHVSVPTLKATFSSADAGDSGTISFQLCADAGCSTILPNSSSAAGLVNGATAGWTPSGLTDGVYYWRVSALDAAGNPTSPQWTSTRAFSLDSSPPPDPTVVSFVDGVRLNQPPTLTAVYNDPSGGSGSLTFEICATSSCDAPVPTGSGTAGSLAAGATGSWIPGFLFDGHYYWRVRSVDAAGNTSAWSAPLGFTVDATPPRPPALVGAAGMRVQSAPVLTARVEDPTDPADSARIYVQVCSDPDCATVLAGGYSGTVPVGEPASWAAPTLGDGTYYWRAFAEDLVGNQSLWSAARVFVVDTVPPAVPTQGGAGNGALVGTPQLSGTFVGSDPGEGGRLQFQVCTDAECTDVAAGGFSATVAAGARASWTSPDPLEDGVYFWRVRSVDAAGNVSAWSPTRTFTLDQTPPEPPQDFRAHINGTMLTLTWRPPAGRPKVRGYALIVNGKKVRTLPAKPRKVRIHLLKHDTRSFAVATIDEAGNMSAATRTIAAFKPPLSLKQARSAALRRHR